MASKISLFLNFDNPNSKKPIPTANCKFSIEFEEKGVCDLKVHLDYSYREFSPYATFGTGKKLH